MQYLTNVVVINNITAPIVYSLLPFIRTAAGYNRSFVSYRVFKLTFSISSAPQVVLSKKAPKAN